MDTVRKGFLIQDTVCDILLGRFKKETWEDHQILLVVAETPAGLDLGNGLEGWLIDALKKVKISDGLK